MSGHSKWAKIKRAKGANDAKRGALFTKLARNITMAAQEGGGDPDMNFTLRLAVDKAKQANMPLDNIDRAIKKGTGGLTAVSVQRTTYEAITPYGISLLVDCTSDNTNRTVSEVRNALEKLGAKMGAAGSVSWQFAEIGQITVGAAKLKKATKHGAKDTYENADLEELEMFLLDVPGISDFEVYDPSTDADFEAEEDRPADRKYVYVTTVRTDLKSVADAITAAEWQILDTEVVKKAENRVELSSTDSEKLAHLVETLEDHDDVDNVWTNAKD